MAIIHHAIGNLAYQHGALGFHNQEHQPANISSVRATFTSNPAGEGKDEAWVEDSRDSEMSSGRQTPPASIRSRSHYVNMQGVVDLKICYTGSEKWIKTRLDPPTL
ncbi:hypothetical protein C8R45DRAFT_926653 [Mycena sanguinolenta]|nr:hypothetical protein C8R45DRAFT_926653 [Mycena sanguinolenta]